MRVDRQTFLVTVAAISAACGAPSQPGSAPLVVALPAQATATPDEAPPKPAPSSEGVSRPVATSSSEGYAPSAEGYVAPSAEGYVPPTTEGGASSDGAMCRAKAIARPTTCDDARGSPGDCRKAMCSMGFICDQCEAYKRYFKPKIAERAVACVVRQSAAQSRDGCRTYQCGDEALKSACIDSTADAECKSIAKTCKVSLDECRGMLSGMNAAGRAKVATCAAKCPYGLWSCVEGI